jgi:uncharacterized Ntn-hydrolase superfamily protein
LARASTYSIVACDTARGEWGCAVQSKFLAVGSLVTWAEPGVGAVATQAWAKVSYGPDGLALLRGGVPAAEVVARLTAADPGREHRQLGVVDALGRAASYTGSGCLEWAGGRTGAGYAAQGNILVSAETVDALAETFEANAGRPLAERLLASLAAAQAAGGDRRGQQSSALYVVEREAGYDESDVKVDLRVDDHPRPIEELERLYGLHQLYFGETPQEEWLPVDGALRVELRERLDRLDYATGDLAADLDTWAGMENLEERVRGVQRIDPVVLDALRSR